MASVSVEKIPSTEYHHTPSYCEENVYLLCKSLCTSGVAEADGSDLYVVFISNEKKQVPLWHQKASHRADGVILWDYHVICIQRKKSGISSPQVWDLDSTLSFPSPLALYISETIRPSFQLFSDFQRFFRVVHAPMFLLSFASDRRHMKDAADGTVHNLNEYIKISSADIVRDIGPDLMNEVRGQKLGVVMSEKQLEEFFSLSLQ